MLVLIGMYLMIIIYLCRIKTSEDIANRSMTRLKEIVPYRPNNVGERYHMYENGGRVALPIPRYGCLLALDSRSGC